MATWREHIGQNSGIPLGGLGTGSVELRADGYFHEWQIFNVGSWAPQQPACCTKEQPPMGPGALAFFVRTQAGGAPPLMRRLGLRTDQHNLYSFPWLKSPQSLEFSGTYPVAHLRYQDADLPVAIEATAFSPFIPHDARTSGTPGCHLVFRLRNRSAQPQEVALLGTLKNPLAHGLADRKLANEVRAAGDQASLTMRTRANGNACQPSVGSLSLAVRGGEPSWVTGEYGGFFHGLCHTHWHGPTPYGMAHECLLHDFRAAGRLPSLPGDRSPTKLLPLTNEAVAALTPAGQERLVKEFLRYPFARSLWDKVMAVDPQALADDAGRTTFLQQINYRLHLLDGPQHDRQTWGDAALATRVTLAPEEEREVVFVLGWHFPWHYSAKGPVLGHQYEHWFADAAAVTDFLLAHHAAHRRAVERFAATLFDTTLPPELADAWAGQLTTIPKCTWWTKAGDFAVWEGLGCCGFHTTDITYQGSFNLLALFPDLQQQQMLMGARFQRADGRVHHFFTPDLSAVDNGFDRVDMNQQFVLLVCRDYLWTGDRKHLKRLWPHLVSAMANTAALDQDGDGLPDHDTRRNTYDAWDFSGTPAYIASLWLSALLAAARVAEDLGQTKQARQWRALLRRGAASFDAKLWNGEYYSLWVDGAARDECCMSDQIDGEWFTQLVGLGHALPRARIVAALQAIVRHNFSPENGLLNATYPPGRAPRLAAYHNLQAMAPWTGIEYAIASMLMDFGLPAAGVAVVKNIHERYLRAGRAWNHVECGDHYYRAMSSWAVLLGATGFKVDAPRGVVSFAPAVPLAACRAPWVSATGWGSFAQTAERFTLECHAGTLACRTLRLTLPAGDWRVTLNGRSLTATVEPRDGATLVRPRAALALAPGDVLLVAPR